MSAYNVIANIEDPITGALHQVAIESYTPDSTGETVIGVRVNGTSLPTDHPFYTACVKYWLEYCDHLAGIMDLDDYLFNLSLPVASSG